MNLTGEHKILKSRETVWEALNNPDVLKSCLPGCEDLCRISETEMTAKITTKIGPVKATFLGTVNLFDLDPPNSYCLNGEGQGGAAGFASGSAKVKLAEDDQGGTILTYSVEAKVGGKLAQIGSRLIDSVTKKLAAQFFDEFIALVEGSDAESFPIEANEPEKNDEVDPGIRSKRGIPTPFWVVGTIGVVALLILWAAGVL